MGGKGGGGGSTNTTSQPPAWLYPDIALFLQKIAGGPNALANESYKQAGFPNQQVAGFTPLEQQGINLAGIEANQTAGLNANAINEANATLRGQYLTTPQNVLDAANRETMFEFNQSAAPSEMSAAAQAGAFGGSADAETRALGQFNLETALTDPFAQNYEAERQNQINTANDAAKISLGAQIPSETLLQAGGIQQNQQQAELNALYNNLYNQAAFPFEQANLLGGALGTASGNSGTVTQSANNGGGGWQGALQSGLGLGGLGTLLYLLG